MSLQTPLSCSFIIAQMTRILDFLMDRFNMSLQMSLCCCFIFTMMTRILFVSIVNWFYMFFIFTFTVNYIKIFLSLYAHQPSISSDLVIYEIFVRFNGFILLNTMINSSQLLNFVHDNFSNILQSYISHQHVQT